MGFTEVFSRKKEVTLTLEEQQKENKQLIRKACRELNREKNALERQEKKTVMDIKAAAKKGQMGSVKIMAKDLVRNRKYQAKFMEMQSNLQGVQLKMRAMNSSQQMAQAMSGVTKAMKMTTKNMDIQGINQMMMEFQRESEKMNLMGDMVDDAIGDAMDDVEDEEATEQLVNQVLDEIGIELSTEMATAGTSAMPQTRVQQKNEEKQAMAEGANAMDDELMNRLNNLKK